jgi:hypothetical protein
VFSVARQSHVTDVVLVELRARTLSTPGGVSRIGLFIGRFLGAAVGHSWGVQGAYAIGVSGPVGAAILLLAAGDRAGVDGPAIPERQSIRQCSGTAATPSSPSAGVLVIAVARASRTSLVPLSGEHIGL